MTIRKAVLLVGSPRKKVSASFMLGSYLMQGLEARGVSTATYFSPPDMEREGAVTEILSEVMTADLVVLSFPLYVDHLPAPVIAFLEQYHAVLRDRPSTHQTAIASITQCGFPEGRHNKLAIEIVRQFAAEAGLDWAGGLAMGMGGALSGNALNRGGGFLRRQALALDQAAIALAVGNPISDETCVLFSRPLMPRWLYTLFANWGMRRRAKKALGGVRADAQPYLLQDDEVAE